MAVRTHQAIAIGAVVFALLFVGCASRRSMGVAHPLARHAAPPKELVMLCRPNVLQMADNSRVPGVVAQVFLMAGDSKGPTAAPTGEFRFAASPDGSATTDATPPQLWSFPPDETARHQINHSLGPCYVFWLPCRSSEEAARPLVVQARFEWNGQQIQSSPVKVSVAGG